MKQLILATLVILCGLWGATVQAAAGTNPLGAGDMSLRLAPRSTTQDGNYQLGAGDVIRITVFQNPDLTIETRISESGEITYPLLGSVSVGSLSIAEAERRIARQLQDGGFVLKPQVNILVVQMRGHQVSVLGQVNRPGRYPLELANMRLADILALAGGITQNGADMVILVGERDGRQTRVEVDLPAMFISGRMEQNLPVYNGDTIYVHRTPQFYVHGQVNRPGNYRLERNMTVMQALATAGGLTLRGTVKGLSLYRQGSDGKVAAQDPSMEQPIQADDVLFIRESLF